MVRGLWGAVSSVDQAGEPTTGAVLFDKVLQDVDTEVVRVETLRDVEKIRENVEL